MTEQADSIRRVIRQNSEIALKELDRLYSESRQKDEVISMQTLRIEKFEVSYPDSIAHAQRERYRMRQDGIVLDFTIQFAICGWIVAFVAIGYGVWVG